MPSPSPEPSSTDSIHTQRALATVEAFLQASNSPEYKKTAWLYLKKCLQELTRTHSTPTPPAHDKILKRLTAIEKKLSAQTAMLPKPPTYADHAHLAPPQNVYEKPVPGRVLKEVTVKVLEYPKPTQISERLVETINAARSSKAGKVLAAQKLQNRNLCITTDSHETKALLEHEEGRTQVIARRTKVRGQRFTVMAHSVKKN